MSDKPKLKFSVTDLKELVDCLVEGNSIEQRHIDAITQNPRLAKLFRSIIIDKIHVCSDSFTRTFSFTVDRGQSLESLGEQLSNLGWKSDFLYSSDIKKVKLPSADRSSTEGVESLEMGFSYSPPFEGDVEAVSEIYMRGMRLATDEELLSFTLQHPNFRIMGNLGGPIVAFGTSWKVDYEDYGYRCSQIVSLCVDMACKIIGHSRRSSSSDYLRHPIFVAGVVKK